MYSLVALKGYYSAPFQFHISSLELDLKARRVIKRVFLTFAGKRKPSVSIGSGNGVLTVFYIICGTQAEGFPFISVMILTTK